MKWPIGASCGMFAAIFILVPGVTAFQDDGGRFVAGQVIDASGAPVPLVRMEAQAERDIRHWESVAASVSDAKGRFMLGPLPALPSVLSVRASKEGFTTSRISASPGSTLTFRLGPAGILQGRVLRDDGGQPVPGFRIEVDHERGGWSELVSAGSDGTFQVPGIPAGRCFLSSAPGESRRVTVEGVEVRPGRTTVRDLWLPRGPTVHGRVTGTDGKPVVGALVRVSLVEVRTDLAGSYRIEGFPSHGGSTAWGPPEVVFEAQGLQRLAQEVILSPGTREFRLDAVLEPVPASSGDSMIRGRVMLAGTPVPGARLTFDPGALFRRPSSVLVASAGDGTFAIGGPFSSRPHRLFARTDDGLVGVSPPISKPLEEASPLVIEMNPSADVRGTVRTKDGKPAVGMLVGVRSAGDWEATRESRYLSTAISDDEGRFRVRVPPGRVLLNAGRGDEAASRSLDSVAPGAVVEGVDLLVRGGGPGRSGSLTGVVMDETGRPIDGVTVFAFGLLAETNAEGSFTLAGVGEETYCVNFTHADYADEALFHVKTSRSPLRVVLRKGLEIRGRVVAEPGVAPARAFRIWMRHLKEDTPWTEWREQNDGEGRFVLRSLEPGVYSLRVQAEDRSSARIDGIEVAPGKPVSEVMIPLRKGGTISGTVRDSSGRPCPHFDVWGSGPVECDEVGGYREWKPVATTDSTGRFVWAGLAEGSHRVGLRAGGPPADGTRPVEASGGKGADRAFEATMRTVKVVAGQEAAVELVR